MTSLGWAGAALALFCLIIWWLARVNRAQGRAEAEVKAATIDQKTVSDVHKIQADPLPSRNELINRMRKRPGVD